MAAIPGFDDLTNFPKSTVATAPVPALSGTSLTVRAGDGVIFPSPPFNIVICPQQVSPLTGNAEIARVTSIISGDTLVIVRAQEGTTAKAITSGYQVYAGITQKTIQDIQTATLNTAHIIGDEDISGTKTFTDPVDLDGNVPINPQSPGFRKSPSGLLICGHSWAIELDITTSGVPIFPRYDTSTSVPSSRYRHWVHILRQQFGLPDSIRSFGVGDKITSAASRATPLFLTEDYGYIYWCLYTPTADQTTTASGRTFSLNAVDALAPLNNYATTGSTLNGGTPITIPWYANAFSRIVKPGQLIYWNSVGAGTIDPGGVVTLAYNSTFSNFAVSGSRIMSNAYNTGGWGTYDINIDRNPQSTTVNSVGMGRFRVDIGNQPITANLGSLAIILTGQNDLTLHPDLSDQAGFKETIRFLIGKFKTVFHVKSTDVGGSIVYVNGSGGGVWTTVNEATPFTSRGTHKEFTGTPGVATKSTIQINIPSNYTGSAIGLAFVSQAGAAGGVGTITVDGQSPTVGNYKINQTTDDQIDISAVTPDQTVPVYKRITGLSAGVHTILVTVNTMDAGGKFIFNWWNYETDENPVMICNQPVLMTGVLSGSGGRAIVTAWNTTFSDLVAEWTDGSVMLVNLQTGLNEYAPYFAPDGAHPTDLGNQRIAQLIYDTLQGDPTVTNDQLNFR